jgi:hypothetical protein
MTGSRDLFFSLVSAASDEHLLGRVSLVTTVFHFTSCLTFQRVIRGYDDLIILGSSS